MSDATTNEKILEIGAKRLWEMEVEANPPVVPVSWELIGPSWAGEVYRERVNAILQAVAPIFTNRAKMEAYQELFTSHWRLTDSGMVFVAQQISDLTAEREGFGPPKGY